jgi:hypothetical protein
MAGQPLTPTPPTPPAPPTPPIPALRRNNQAADNKSEDKDIAQTSYLLTMTVN